MTAILTAVTLFAAVLIVLDRVPKHYLTTKYLRVRCDLRRDGLTFWIICPVFAFEWDINRSDIIMGRTVNGMQLAIGCEDWWARRTGEPVTYRRVVVDSREWTTDEERCRWS